MAKPHPWRRSYGSGVFSARYLTLASVGIPGALRIDGVFQAAMVVFSHQLPRLGLAVYGGSYRDLCGGNRALYLEQPVVFAEEQDGHAEDADGEENDQQSAEAEE